MRKMAVWKVVELPKGKKAVGSRWVFKHKLDAAGKVCRFKARMVAKGYTQKRGIDFNETFAPVAKLSTLRLFFTLAGNNGWKVDQLDAKTAFLCAEIDEHDVYIKPPQGLRLGTKYKNPVLHLQKGIYGLRQSPRLWYGRLTTYLRKIGFVMSQYDNCVWTNSILGLMVVVYVDDMLVTGKEESIPTFKALMGSEFEMVDSGDVSFFLGIQVRRGGADTGGFTWTQEHYIEKLLKEWDMEEAHPVKTPMQKSSNLSKRKDNEPPTDKTRYQSAIGSLMYLMMATRPDIAFAVSHLSKFCADPSEHHWTAVKRVFRYLKGTSKLGLRLGHKSNRSGIVGYTDADWASDTDDRKSV